MKYKLANKTILGATFWKFLLLFAALSFSYSSPAIAEENASDYDIAADLEDLMSTLPAAGEDDKEAIETQDWYAQVCIGQRHSALFRFS